jgi:hypothetical protein
LVRPVVPLEKRTTAVLRGFPGGSESSSSPAGRPDPVAHQAFGRGLDLPGQLGVRERLARDGVHEGELVVVPCAFQNVFGHRAFGNHHRRQGAAVDHRLGSGLHAAAPRARRRSRRLSRLFVIV